jgi:hypothetical protein
MRFTGRRKPISMSGAGKAVSVIFRRRPCFLWAFLAGDPFAEKRVTSGADEIMIAS